MATLDFTQLQFERLHPSHNIEQFDCGDDELNRFLRHNALDVQSSLLGTTTLAMYEGSVAGYFTIQSDLFKMSDLDKPTKRLLKQDLGEDIKNIPAVSLRCLAVRTDLQRSGLGRYLFSYVQGFAYRLPIGYRFLVLPAKVDLVKMYLGWGLTPFKQYIPKVDPCWMWMDLTKP